MGNKFRIKWKKKKFSFCNFVGNNVNCAKTKKKDTIAKE